VKTFKAKSVAICVLVMASVVSHAGAQEGYEPQKPSPSQQQYKYEQEPDSNIVRQRSYDPNAELHSYQNRRSLREQINPCNRDYGVIMDGWHDAVLMMTVKSAEWWLSVILLLALVVVGFDDLFRKWRAKDMREALAGVALLMLNDRAYCLRRANDAIYRHNKLILQGDTLAQAAEALGQAETHMAIRSAVINAAESRPVLEAEYPPTLPAQMSNVAPVMPTPESGDKVQGAQAGTDGEIGEDGENASGDTDASENAKISTYEHGGKKYKVPTPIRLLVQAQIRKIENQRIKINQLEERLSRYEKD
jgi:hypothetical protein